MVVVGLVEWINKNGKISIKCFTDNQKMGEFLEKLQARNAYFNVTKI